MGGGGDLDHLEAVAVGVVVVADHSHVDLRARVRPSHIITSHGSGRGVGSGTRDRDRREHGRQGDHHSEDRGDAGRAGACRPAPESRCVRPHSRLPSARCGWPLSRVETRKARGRSGISRDDRGQRSGPHERRDSRLVPDDFRVVWEAARRRTQRLHQRFRARFSKLAAFTTQTVPGRIRQAVLFGEPMSKRAGRGLTARCRSSRQTDADPDDDEFCVLTPRERWQGVV